MLNLSEIRKEYKLKELRKEHVAQHPSDQFAAWMEEAMAANVCEPTAMNLATVSADGRPSARIILLKGIEQGNLFFYTNYHSRKGIELEACPFAAITFFWPELERQVRIEGKVLKADAKISDQYFSSRPRESQVSAIVSPQSAVIENRRQLEKMYQEAEEMYELKAPSRPEAWGGYKVIPDYFEFWQGRTGRLHDRIAYLGSEQEGWVIKRLAP